MAVPLPADPGGDCAVLRLPLRIPIRYRVFSARLVPRSLSPWTESRPSVQHPRDMAPFSSTSICAFSTTTRRHPRVRLAASSLLLRKQLDEASITINGKQAPSVRTSRWDGCPPSGHPSMSLSLADIGGRPAAESACFGTHTLSHSGRPVSNEETLTTSAKHEDCKRNNSHDEGALIHPLYSTSPVGPLLAPFVSFPSSSGSGHIRAEEDT